MKSYIFLLGVELRSVWRRRWWWRWWWSIIGNLWCEEESVIISIHAPLPISPNRTFFFSNERAWSYCRGRGGGEEESGLPFLFATNHNNNNNNNIHTHRTYIDTHMFTPNMTRAVILWIPFFSLPLNSYVFSPLHLQLNIPLPPPPFHLFGISSWRLPVPFYLLK